MFDKVMNQLLMVLLNSQNENLILHENRRKGNPDACYRLITLIALSQLEAAEPRRKGMSLRKMLSLLFKKLGSFFTKVNRIN